MENLGDMLAGQFGKLEVHEGECPVHGKRPLYLPRGVAFTIWHCSECAMVEHKAADDLRYREGRIDWLLQVSQVPTKYRGQRFMAHTKDQQAVRIRVKEFRDEITSAKRWAGLVLTGEAGTGKTLLASELAEALIRNFGMTVRYCTVKQMIAEIQASYHTEGKTEEGEILKFIQFDLLMLDEVDIKRDTDASNLLLTEVINRRYNEGKPVVVITNQSIDKLADFVGSRVDDRLRENSFVCTFDWPSFRGQ
jgi:DNA replication protein DnaC